MPGGLNVHPTDLQPSLQGHSIGRWEAGTLVVETTGFAPHEEGLGFAMPSSEGKRLVERFALAEDRRHLVYDVTVVDPSYLARPVEFQAMWEHSPDLRPSGVACDLAVARRYLQDDGGIAPVGQQAVASSQASRVWRGRGAAIVGLIVLGMVATVMAIRIRRRTTGGATRRQQAGRG